jgi:hypothetical protein
MEKAAQWGASYFVFILKYHYADQIKENEWKGHVARMREGRKCKRFWWESQKESDHSENRQVGEMMV